jgi:hypothetical protein
LRGIVGGYVRTGFIGPRDSEGRVPWLFIEIDLFSVIVREDQLELFLVLFGRD